MKHSPALAILVLLATMAFGAVESLPSRPLAQKGKLLFADDFERTGLGNAWQSVIPSFSVTGGVLKGTQTRDDHGAVAGTSMPLRDGNVILELRFRFDGARTIHVLCDDKTCESVHAGHISRIVIAPDKITVYDDKEGVMRNDIYALRKSTDPEKKAEAQRRAVGRLQSFPLRLEVGKWYRLGLEIVGDEMRATIDGETVAFLKSSGLTHPRKSDLRINVWGRDGDGFIDDLQVWSVEPHAK